MIPCITHIFQCITTLCLLLLCLYIFSHFFFFSLSLLFAREQMMKMPGVYNKRIFSACFYFEHTKKKWLKSEIKRRIRCGQVCQQRPIWPGKGLLDTRETSFFFSLFQTAAPLLFNKRHGFFCFFRAFFVLFLFFFGNRRTYDKKISLSINGWQGHSKTLSFFPIKS